MGSGSILKNAEMPHAFYQGVCPATLNDFVVLATDPSTLT
jgi:hypothetical protein